MNSVLAERSLPHSHVLQLVEGDLTVEEVDAIVNAANEHLQHGGGVAWAILRRGGDVIQQESDDWVARNGPVTHACPAWTSGGLLPAKYVIHAVGPIWGDGGEDAKLAAAVRGSLQVADELELKSIAMPAISTGIFGFPKGRAAEVIFRAIRKYFERHPESGLKLVRIVLFEPSSAQVFLDVWNEWKS